MSDLLPCPFCGGKAEWKSGGPGSAWVSCKSCPAETGDGAIPRIRDAWNRRALPAVQPDAAAREAALRGALIGLLADIQDYQRINNLGGENNHWQVIARALIDSPGKEVMPDETNDPRHTQSDTAPAGLSAGGGAPVTVQEAARVLLAWPAQRAVFDACSGVVKVYRFNAVLQSLSAPPSTEGGA